MPFIARDDDRHVIPADVADGDDVHCLTCGAVMRARGPFDDGRSRHFYHLGDDASCSTAEAADSVPSPAESTTHQKLKALAVTGLRRRFPNYERCGPEIAVEAPLTRTDVAERRADALGLQTDR